MSGNGEVSESRAQALLKETAITEAQRRSAAVTLIDRALIVTGWTAEAEAAGTWDKAAAVAEARDALDTAGLRAGGTSQPLKNPGCANTIVNYERPGH